MTVTTTRPASAGAASQKPRRPSPSPISLTGRGGVSVVFAFGLLGAVLSAQLHLGLIGGLLFAIGCALAALGTRPADLLTLAVSPPLAFFAATLIAQFLAALGDTSVLQSLVTGLLLALAAGAPWLFLGTALVVAITLRRGLTACLRDLRTRLAGTPKRVPADDLDADPVRWDV